MKKFVKNCHSIENFNEKRLVSIHLVEKKLSLKFRHFHEKSHTIV